MTPDDVARAPTPYRLKHAEASFHPGVYPPGMDCPRCDRTLERYALAGREAVYCQGCGYMGVPVEHRGELREVESWDDAISRFHEVNHVRAGTVETSDDPAPAFDLEGADGEPAPTVVRIESPGPDVPVEIEANGDADEADVTAGVRGDEADTTGVTCEVCGKRFEEQAQLDGHSAVHSDREE